jgi:hypothetical protein
MSAYGGTVVFNQVTKDAITATIQPDAADVGRSVNVWMAANFQGAWYLRDGNAWTSYQSGPYPVAMRNITLSASTPITVVRGMDVTALSGIQIYVGYGVSEQDMLTSPGKLASLNPVMTFPVMRGASLEGNWGGNSGNNTDFRNVPDSHIQRLRDDNVEWVGIKLSIFNETIADPVVKVRYRPANDRDYSKMYSFNDDDLVSAVTKLRQQGFKVYLSLILMQPQAGDTSTSPSSGGCNTSQYAVDSHLLGDPAVPVYNNSWFFGSACVNPAYWWWNPSHPSHAANVATFWATYTQVAVKYAKLAQQLGVGMFAIGEETDRLFRTRSSPRFPNHFRNELSQMVGAVRSEYTGLLTYGQNGAVYTEHPEWWGYDAAASSSLFQDLGLDVVGLSAYFTLVNPPITRVYSVPELETAWASVFQRYFVPIRANNPNTPIIFTDTGASDSVNIPSNPLSDSGAAYVFSDANNNGIDDGMEQQANMFQALFNVNRAFNYLVRGTTFWGFNIDTNPFIFAANNNTRNTELHSRPAEQVLRNAYGALKIQ